jgi:DNA-binding CsgD family transcriptional regulator
VGIFASKIGKKVKVFISRSESALEEGMMDLIQRIPEASIQIVGASEQVLPENAVVLHQAELPLNWNSSSSQLLLVFREHWSPLDMEVWKRRGASGWLDLLDPPAEIRTCVTEAMNGRVPVATSRCRPFLHRLHNFSDPRLGYGLTRRELEITRHMMAGLSSKELAKRVGVSPHTVNAHKKAIYRKLGAHSIVQVMKKIENLGVNLGPGALVSL